MAEKDRDDDDTDRREIDQKRYKLELSLGTISIGSLLSLIIVLWQWSGTITEALAEDRTNIQNHGREIERNRTETVLMLIEINRKLDRLAERK